MSQISPMGNSNGFIGDLEIGEHHREHCQKLLTEKFKMVLSP